MIKFSFFFSPAAVEASSGGGEGGGQVEGYFSHRIAVYICIYISPTMWINIIIYNNIYQIASKAVARKTSHISTDKTLWNCEALQIIIYCKLDGKLNPPP